MNNLKDLEQPRDFVDRHCGFSKVECKEILAELGFSSLEEFVQEAVPSKIYSSTAPDLGKIFSEDELLNYLQKISHKNKIAKSMIGLGYYGTKLPLVILRNLLESPAWYTAYTPYQAEISQGRLEMLLNFQTMLSDLTGLPLAGASLLDEATAAAESMTLFHRASKKKHKKFLADKSLFPQNLALLKSRSQLLDIELVITDPSLFDKQEEVFGCLIAYPKGDGSLCDYSELIEKLHKKEIYCACTTDLLALLLLKTPASMGFDVAVGSSQRFGVPMGFGGPHAGFIAFREEFQRQVPGRIVGVSKDTKEKVGYRLALQTREQHIRREKATSNICTAQALPAMIATAYAIYHGPERLKAIAERVHSLTSFCKKGVESLGYKVLQRDFFDTIQIKTEKAQQIKEAAEKENINIFCIDENTISISCDEEITLNDIKLLLNIFAKLKNQTTPELKNIDIKVNIPNHLQRESDFLQQQVFNSYHTEHEMLRYLKRLSDKDIALNRSMIPLGSCTMKLNATCEMIPISWPEFANIHPFAPKEQVQGYLEVLEELSDLLIKITGFSGVSLQPNAGAQGELAGLLAIRHYFDKKGEENRNICLIPESAHGTNPASAVMAGMKVVIVKIDKEGQVLLEDLYSKVKQHKENLAALMMTYPSTCGVFGEGIIKICEVVHEAGGQVYMDGANLNALVGIVYPGKIGPDVMHINLHKTFCIPHGGGGPGMGPIVVKKHLIPFLPNHPFSFDDKLKGKNRTISAAPLGSGLILLISWAYIRLMGGAGLRTATIKALLAANYIAKKLEPKFPILYKGSSGFVAHECIVDMRGFKKSAGVSVEDIAKRLIDYGYHAPTVSWPIAGTVMIEPTESESKAELDRFCDAFFSIYKEIMQVQKGEYSKEDNLLVNAPHTAADLVSTDWQHSYTREQAVFPLAWVKKNKYWPPINRIDSAWGDRNLLCSCPPPEAYEE